VAILVVVVKAEPAKLVSAFGANHVVATPIFLDKHTTSWARHLKE
jgi:hypothetical protein